MSDSEDSMVTYTELSSPFEDLSDIGSLGVDRFPMMLEDPYVEAALQAPPSPDYVPSAEHPPSPVYVPYVPEPVYLEFMPPEDDVLLAEEQPLPIVVSAIADSPGYITESYLEEDPEEDCEDLEEGPADYPTDRDDDDEEDKEEPSGDDADNEEEDEDKDEEGEEEHLASVDSVLPLACRTTARMSIRDQIPIPFPLTAEVDRFLAISTPPPSPLTSYSSPLPHIPSPTLPVSSPLPVLPPPLPASLTYPLGYRAAMIQLRAESPSTSHPLLLPSHIILPHTRESVAMMRVVAPSTYILAPRLGILSLETPPSGTPPVLPKPLPTPSPPLLLPSTDCRAGVSKVGYGITDTWDEMVEDMQGRPAATNVAGLSQRMTDFVTTVRQDIDDIYRRLDYAHDDRSLMSGQLNMLRRDRQAYDHTARLIESEARLSHEA
ncbi:hypothetical protein Tco_0724205 [Tanacetum coccineum]